MEPLLIVAPFFAPQSHAAMFRVHKLVKYLPKYGYKPIVVTVDTNFIFNEDEELLSELSGVEIHRVRHIEPSIRGLRMLLGGGDRTFSAIKKSGKINFTPSDEVDTLGVRNKFQIKKIISRVLRAFKLMPDAHWTWISPAVKKSVSLINENNIKLMFSTANPNSVLKICSDIKTQTGIKWVSDYRDPVGYGDRFSAPLNFFRKREEKWIQNAMSMAEMTVGTADAYGSIFLDMYGLPPSKFKCIPTGVDEKYKEEIGNDDIIKTEKVLLFVGEFLQEYDAYIFTVIAQALREGICSSDFVIEVIGRREVNEPNVSKLIYSMPELVEFIRYVDHVPQKELYQKINQAHGCLLIPGRYQFWWCTFAKMIDYIGLNKQVLALVPEVSVSAVELRKAGLGFLLTGDLRKDTTLFAEFLETNKGKGTSYCERYVTPAQLESFCEIFNDLRTDIGQ